MARFLLLLSLLAGCAPVQQLSVNYAAIGRGQLTVYDIKTGPHWWQRVLTPAHRFMVYRDEKGELTVLDEQVGQDSLTGLSTPVEWGLSHATIPVR